MLRRLQLLLLFSLVIALNAERYLRNIRQLTFGGANTEGYFSFDDTYITYQAHGEPYGNECDQIYRLNLAQTPYEKQIPHKLSTGIGSTTCSFAYPDNKHALYAGNFHKTHITPKVTTNTSSCPVKKCQSEEAKRDAELKRLCESVYTWDIFPTYDIFKVNEHGNLVEQLTDTEGYDAEGVVSPDGKLIVFTSVRSGDLELWIMNVDGTGLKQLTNVLGYDGGAFFSPDSKKVVFRASRPQSEEEILDYRKLLRYGLVSPVKMELYTVNVDGSEMKQVTNFGRASWAPYFLNDGHRIIFSSDYGAEHPFSSFSLWKINDDGSDLERITDARDGFTFDSFPMMSHNGKLLVWGSSRGAAKPGDINLFLADWVDDEDSNNIVEVEDEALMNRVEQRLKWSQVEFPLSWADTKTTPYDGVVHFDGEYHLQNVKQLTFGGQNAEGYFSFDNTRLTLQATGRDYYGTECDQIYQLDLTVDPRNQTARRLSTGLGVCTCSYFFKESDNEHILYAGTFEHVRANSSTIGNTCPPKKCQQPNITDPVLAQLCNTSYTWDIYPDYDIFKVNRYGNVVQQLTDSPGYDAEGVVSPDGKLIAFTSMRGGDLDLWIMNADGTNVRQVTNVTGYDGGSFFSPDGKRLIFRASRPKTDEEIKKYKALLSYDLVAPTQMELFVIDIDGTNMRQITNLGGASWAPYYLNDNKRVIFSTDHAATNQGFGAFDLFLINDDGTGLERVTWDEGLFDAFPMMSYDGKKLVWGSSRNGSAYDLNLFIADWNDVPPSTGSTADPSGSQTTAKISHPILTHLSFIFIEILMTVHIF